MMEPQNVPSLAFGSVVARSDGVVDAEIDNEIVVLNIERGTTYSLNQVGSRIWRLLEPPIRVSALCETLLTEYNVEPDVCESEVINLLEKLLSEGLIVRVTAESDYQPSSSSSLNSPSCS
jgi:hypothetical protein